MRCIERPKAVPTSFGWTSWTTASACSRPGSIISPDLFVQVYRNDLYDTTNLVVLYGGRRLYARDQLGGRWHRHTAEAPDVHDTSADGSRAVELAEFLDEAEAVLAAMGLP